MASAPGSALGAVAPVHAVFTPIKIRAAPVSDRVDRAEIEIRPPKCHAGWRRNG